MEMTEAMKKTLFNKSQGVPGSLKVLCDVARPLLGTLVGEKILNKFLSKLSENGSDIWILFKDIHREDLDKFFVSVMNRQIQ